MNCNSQNQSTINVVKNIQTMYSWLRFLVFHRIQKNGVLE